MSTATLTVPKALPVRTVAVVIPFYDLPNGGRVGFLTIRVGKARDYYRASLQDRDDFGECWALAKEQRDGTFAEPYLVTLPCRGNTGKPTCTCNGWRYSDDFACRHTRAMTAMRDEL